jgi:hypothetical protein
MEKNLAILALKKAEERRPRRNELAKKMREKRGDELKEKQREYAKIHRNKRKKEIEDAMAAIKKEEEKPKEIPIQKDIVKIEKNNGVLISKIEKTGIKGVSEKTANDYISKISIIHKILSKNFLDKEVLKRILMGKDELGDATSIINNMEYIKDIDKVIKIIDDKYDNLQTKKAYISSFITLVSYLPTVNKDNYDKIRKRFEEINNEIYGVRGENGKDNIGLINTELANMIDKDIYSFDEEEIMQNIENIGTDDRLIYLFYTLQPPRRNDDVYLINIKKINSDEEVNYNILNAKENYIIVDEDNNPNEIVYNKYKTYKIYGKQSIMITNNNLKEIIKNYIYRYSLNDGDKLFRKFSSSATFNVAIKRIFSKIYSKKITLSNIRYSYIIWDLRTTRSINYLSNLAAMMGHSAEEQQLYKIS